MKNVNQTAGNTIAMMKIAMNISYLMGILSCLGSAISSASCAQLTLSYAAVVGDCANYIQEFDGYTIICVGLYF